MPRGVEFDAVVGHQHAAEGHQDASPFGCAWKTNKEKTRLGGPAIKVGFYRGSWVTGVDGNQLPVVKDMAMV